MGNSFNVPSHITFRGKRYRLAQTWHNKYEADRAAGSMKKRFRGAVSRKIADNFYAVYVLGL